MRRVIDDTMYEIVANRIMNTVIRIAPSRVSEYDYGMYRAKSTLIKQYILREVDDVIFGKNMNTTGIGNNACYEIIYTGDRNEEQICGIIHLTNDMFGSTIVWCSDYDNNRRTCSRKIRGEDPERRW